MIDQETLDAYLDTLEAEEKDEWWGTDRHIAEQILKDFIKWDREGRPRDKRRFI